MNAPANALAARASLKQDAKALHLVEFREQRADVELLQPRNKARPFRWRWTDIEPRLRVAAKTVPIEECERRALVFANPGLDGNPTSPTCCSPPTRCTTRANTRPCTGIRPWPAVLSSRAIPALSLFRVKSCACRAAI